MGFIERRKRNAALLGLLVAWGGTALLVSPATRLLGDPDWMITQCLGELILWLLFAAVLWIVFYWEREPLASLWVRPFRWQSIAWAGLLIGVSIFFLFPITEWVRNAMHLPGYAAGMEKAMAV